MRRLPLWQLLVDRSLLADRKSAEAWVMAGRVRVNGEPARKAGMPCPVDARIDVLGLDRRYVSRGGDKLAEALDRFGLDPSGMVALDAGACTGGFTDCLLQHGARLVYAVEVGYGQLAGRLRADRRVVNLERTNISDLHPHQLDPPPELATVDLSYLSLRRSIPVVARLLHPPASMMCLVKPLFEVDDPVARRTGRIVNPAASYARVLTRVMSSVLEAGLLAADVMASPVLGGKGTREFFVRVDVPAGWEGCFQCAGFADQGDAAAGRMVAIPPELEERFREALREAVQDTQES